MKQIKTNKIIKITKIIKTQYLLPNKFSRVSYKILKISKIFRVITISQIRISGLTLRNLKMILTKINFKKQKLITISQLKM